MKTVTYRKFDKRGELTFFCRTQRDFQNAYPDAWLSTAWCCRKCLSVYQSIQVDQHTFYIYPGLCNNCHNPTVGSLDRLTRGWFPFSDGITPPSDTPLEVLLDEFLYQQGVDNHESKRNYQPDSICGITDYHHARNASLADSRNPGFSRY